ncbi:2-phospho-L-lactate transferase [Rhabdothermincola sediminis]|uniref:2-phospho-L-lactate transferase n=1 Tax=Rhabdothermincola sediminis TaxID=2751370 RepID=UPI001F251DCC|nr:2-phospho-L-lactate transferase [Rhabdothermincola sediminis]
MIAVIAGGVGAARFLTGLVQVAEPASITAIVNVGDDLELHGLHVSPDIDTVTYTLAGAADPERGWGLADESWRAMEALERYGGASWFRLGDLDLGTHLYRTQRLLDGAPLSIVTGEIARAWDVEVAIVPATDDRLRTMVTLPDEGGLEVGFQEYFVQRRHAVRVSALRFDGATTARPAPGVLDAITGADTVVVAPSNPLVSIDPILAVPGIRDAIAARRDRVVAVSPIVAGAALKGPADRLMSELGHEPTVVGVARLYREIAATLVVDEADRELAPAVEEEGLRCVTAPAIMSDLHAASVLAETVLRTARGVT